MMTPANLTLLHLTKTSRRMQQAPLLLLSLLLALSLSAAEPTAKNSKDLPAPQRAKVPKVTAPFTIDGHFTEPAWDQAVLLDPFHHNDGSKPGREPTTVRLCYDDNAIYLAWLCRDSDIQATFTKRDSKFWEEEVVEFFVTTGNLNRYFELQWNPLGGVFDAVIANELDERGVSKRFTGDWSYTAQATTSAVKVDGTVADGSDRDREWRVEVRLPFSDLNLQTPNPGDTWRANFYRFNRSRHHPPELLSWSPTMLGDFHQPTRFGYLEFKKP